MEHTLQNVTLTSVQEKCIVLLNSGLSVTAVAEDLDISRRTIYRWYDQPLFKNKLLRDTSTTVRAYKERLRGLLNNTYDLLEDILTNPEHRNNKNVGRLVEILLKSTGILETKGNQVFIILQSDDAYEQSLELFKHFMERIPLMSEENQKKLLSGEFKKDIVIDDSHLKTNETNDL